MMVNFGSIKKWFLKHNIPALFVVLFLLLNSPDILYLNQFRTYWVMLLGVLFTSSIFLITLYFFRNHLKLFFFFLAFFIFFTPVILFPVLKFRMIFNDSIMMLVYNTNKQEAWELLKPYLIPTITIYIGIILTLIAIFHFLPNSLAPKKAMLTSVMALILLLIIPIINSGSAPYITNLKIMLYSHYPSYLIYYGNRFYHDIKNVENYQTIVKNFSFHAYKKNTLKQKEVHVLVIGETGRYDHWGINGYSRNTSPLLRKEKSLISYTNVITGGGFTEISVPIIITRATPRNFSPVWKEKSIVSVFNEAGFDTWWITDQFYGDDKGMIAIHAQEAAHLLELQKSADTNDKTIWDMNVVDTFKKYMEAGPEKMFFVLHTNGSHFQYTKRYPPQYDIFRPSGYGKDISPSDPANKTSLINGYDNSILYTDAVLDSIIHILDQKNIVGSMLYISDHGENLMDDKRDLFLHSPGGITEYQVHIPLFIYTTPEYDSVYKQKVMNLKSHKDSKISSADVFPTLCNMADIAFPGWDSTRSISSDYFVNRSRYILAGMNHVIKYTAVK